MSLLSCLSSLALRPCLSTIALAAEGPGGSVAKLGFKAVHKYLVTHFTDPSQELQKALGRSADRAWACLEVALGAESILGYFTRRGEDKAFAKHLRAFLDANPLLLPPSRDERFRDQALAQLRAAREAKLIPGTDDSQTLTNQLAAFTRYADPASLHDAEWQVLADVADQLRQAGYEALAEVVALRPDARQQPLLTIAVRFCFRSEVEGNTRLFQGLMHEQVDRLRHDLAASVAGLRHDLAAGFDGLLVVLQKERGRLDEAFTAIALHLRRIEAGQEKMLEELTQVRAELREVLERNHVPAGPTTGPLAISVTNEREREQLRRLRDRLRQLPPDAVAADDWLRLGDGLSAARMFDLARDSHEQAATAARADDDHAREAEASFKAYRDACERGEPDVALAHLQRAVELDEARYQPFDFRQYEPVRILGAGGFGTVFLCRDRYSRRREVAIKALHMADLNRDLDDIFAEAQTLQDLRHPNIIGVLQWNFADRARQERPYLVMEYFAGNSLEGHLRQHGPLSPDDLVAVAGQVARAMQAAHAAGICHRDLKPANILVRRFGASGWEVKVIDLGLAVRQAAVSTSIAVAAQQRTKREQSFAGSLDYAAPEQKGKLPGVEVGPFSDVFSFGKTCFETLFRTTEPVTDDWNELPREWQEPLRSLLEKCVATRLDRRFANFDPGLEALDPQRRAENEEGRRQAEEARQQVERETEQKRRVEEEKVRRQAEEARSRAEAERQRQKAEEQERHHREQEEKKRQEGERRRQVQRKPGDLLVLPLPGGIEIKFAWIPPGTIQMGGDKNADEKPVHRVTLSKGFYMGVFPVSQGQWQAVMGNNPSHFKGNDRPVEQVPWDNCQQFCAKLTEDTGKSIRLPTEAEWEYACRAGTTSDCSSGNDEGALKKVGWYNGNSKGQTQPVGKLAANAWGLYDVHGNVWEWCQDWYGPYPGDNMVDYKGPNNGESRVLRGGSWRSDPVGCNAAYRLNHAPGLRGDDVGCRVCFCLD